MSGPSDSTMQWFDIETRIRNLVKDLVSPIITTADANEASAVGALKKANNNKKKLEELEYAVYNTGNKRDKFDDIHATMAVMVRLICFQIFRNPPVRRMLST